jgi:hypothetical protein
MRTSPRPWKPEKPFGLYPEAVLDALGNACPVCAGTGSLTIAQMEHWKEFTAHHHVESCSDCHEAHLVCDHEIIG